MEKEREVEAAMAEAAVMEAAVADLEVKSSHHSLIIHLPQQSPRQRIEEYVKQHSELSDTVPTKGNSKTELPQNLEDDGGKKVFFTCVSCIILVECQSIRWQCNPPFPHSSHSFSLH